VALVSPVDFFYIEHHALMEEEAPFNRQGDSYFLQNNLNRPKQPSVLFKAVMKSDGRSINQVGAIVLFQVRVFRRDAYCIRTVRIFRRKS